MAASMEQPIQPSEPKNQGNKELTLLFIVILVCFACAMGQVGLIAYTRMVLGSLRESALTELDTKTLAIQPVGPLFKNYLNDDFFANGYNNEELKKMFAIFKKCWQIQFVPYCYYTSRQNIFEDRISQFFKQRLTKGGQPKVHAVMQLSDEESMETEQEGVISSFVVIHNI